ncbi:hypothetical protein ACFQI2_04845 [Bombilactobacillus mellifer]|nr:hypothetical protein [Bombilactobacillus mellifer]
MNSRSIAICTNVGAIAGLIIAIKTTTSNELEAVLMWLKFKTKNL